MLFVVVQVQANKTTLGGFETVRAIAALGLSVGGRGLRTIPVEAQRRRTTGHPVARATGEGGEQVDLRSSVKSEWGEVSESSQSSQVGCNTGYIMDLIQIPFILPPSHIDGWML